jgi:hypothetical protein
VPTDVDECECVWAAVNVAGQHLSAGQLVLLARKRGREEERRRGRKGRAEDDNKSPAASATRIRPR